MINNLNYIVPGHINKYKNIYVHGNIKRLSLYGYNDGTFKKLSFINIINLTRDDLVIIIKAWSPLFEIIFNYLKNRPTIIQLSDGIVFELNSKKNKNKRYGGLYQNNLFDETILFNYFNYKLPYLFNLSSSTKNIPHLKNILLVLGNDFYFNQKKFDVLKNLVKVKSHYNGFNYYVSTKDIFAKYYFLKNKFKIEKINNLNKSNTLIISTPSTCLIELSQKGFLVSLFDQYRDKFFKSLIISHEKAIEQRIGSELHINKRSLNFCVKKSDKKYSISMQYFFKYLLGDLLSLFKFTNAKL